MCSHNTPGSTAFMAGGAWPGGGTPPCTEHVPSEWISNDIPIKSTIIHTHTPYQSIIPKVMIDRTKKEKNQCQHKYFIDSIKQMKYCKFNLMCATTWYEYIMMDNQKSNPWPACGSGGGYSAVHIPAGPLAPIGTQWHVFYLPLSLNTISLCV